VTDEQLTTAQVADRVGISTSTWSSYVTRGQAPPADGRYDKRTPWWYAATVDAWNSTRPGRRQNAGEPGQDRGA